MATLFTSDNQFENDVIKSSIPVIVDFWADWCGPCNAMSPIIEELSSIYENQVLFTKLNVDQNPITPSKYGISSIPTFLVIKNGQIMDSIVGAVTQEILEEKIQEYL